MAFKSANRAVLLAGLEATYGGGTTSFNGILADEGVDISIDADRIERNVIRKYLSPSAPVIGAKSYGLRLDVELKGGGISGGTLQLPEVDPLVLACGMRREAGGVIEMSGVNGTFQVGETVTADDGTTTVTVGEVLDLDGDFLYVRNLQNLPAAGNTLTGATSGATATVNAAYEAYVYRPMSDIFAMSSAAVRFWRDGIDHLLTGVRGTLEVDLTVSQIPRIRFTLTGIYNDPTDTSEPAVTFSEVKPKPCLGVNLYLGGASSQDVIAAQSVQVRLGNDVRPMPDIKADEGRRMFYISNRSPDGSIDPYVRDIAEFNPWEAWKTAGAQKISAEVGDTPGNKVKILVPRAVYNEVAYQDRDGLLAYNLPFTCTGETDDELWLIFW